MNYKNAVQNARKKFLRQKKLSYNEQEIIEKDFKGKDYAYYQSIKDNELFLPEQYSANTTYHRIKQVIQPDISFRPLLKYASVAILLAIVTFSIYYLHKTPENILVSTSYGERKKIELPDGSTVILNSLSSVSYPENMHKSNTREITLDGEAYFDVRKDNRRSFIVKTTEVEVKVLGTKFNVSAYNNDERIVTSLYEGIVSVSSESKDTIQLKPGEQAVYYKESEKIELQTRVTNTQNMWVNGSMYFENIPLKDIFQILEREKQISFQYLDNINRELKITAKFNHNESIDEILEYISQSGEFTFEKKENIYIIKKQKH